MRLRVVTVGVVAMVGLFGTLERVLKLGLPKIVINSYSITEGNGACLEGGGNVGRGSTNEGQNDEATKRTELCKRVSGPWS